MPDGNSGITDVSHCQSCPVRILFKYVKFFSGENIIRHDPDVQQPFVQQLRSPLTFDQLRAL